MERILFVLTSHGTIGNNGKKTGAHLGEITHPYEIFRNAGFDIDFVSPRGGKVPLEHVDLDDPINEKWINNDVFRSKIEATMNPDQVVAHQYQGVYLPGGHGAMFDLPDDETLARIIGQIYEDGGVVGAVCHGSAGLLHVKLSGGESLVDKKEVASFTNEEEVAIGLWEQMPFLLEDRLIEEGAIHKKGVPFQKQVVVAERLVTGQNPASARDVADEMRRLMNRRGRSYIDVEASTIAP